jgi:very-short-patch-repair endonuclease
MIPSVSQNTDYQPYLEWVSVTGVWRNNANLIEAEKIVSLILEIIQRPDCPTLGVVTFNFHQQELIKDLLEAKLEAFANENNPLFELLQNALYRTQNDEFVGLFVKNIENVQGDERDIILFSVGYAKNEQGKLQANFGLLNLQGGENRLNVAITRARLKIYVVCSFYPSELAVEHSKHEGPKMFKRYLESVYAGNQTYSLLNQPLASPTSQNLIVDFLAKKLVEKGYIFERNVGNTRYKIDLAIRQSDENSPFVLAIECEGTHYFSGTSAKEREVYRQQLLLQNGWRFYRVWARNFWANSDAELEKIVRIVNGMR